MYSKALQLANTVCFYHRVQCIYTFDRTLLQVRTHTSFTYQDSFHKATPFSQCAKQRHLELATLAVGFTLLEQGDCDLNTSLSVCIVQGQTAAQ